MTSRVPFDALCEADLVVGAIYEGGAAGNTADDPIARLLPVGNQGGFRFKGRRTTHEYAMAVLYTSGADSDWPDTLEPESGQFTYFGDNKRPGTELHATSRGGNALLRFAFDALHGQPPTRNRVPPFLVFRRATRNARRDVEFLGLAVPGARDVTPSADLVAIWRTTRGLRFQNYRAVFTILDVATVSRAWVSDLVTGHATADSCPTAFRNWVEHGTYRPLMAPRTTNVRSAAEQQPNAADAYLVAAVYDWFRADPYRFEACAMELWRMSTQAAVTDLIGTRRTSDGGRDAVGLYALGPSADPIHLDFSLEAKCYSPTTGVGVRDLARLISRLRHRQFGVFVTTSYVRDQAYRELREDGHPVVVICGADIASLLKTHGYGSVNAVRDWLRAQFGPPA